MSKSSWEGDFTEAILAGDGGSLGGESFGRTEHCMPQALNLNLRASIIVVTACMIKIAI
jgi:hypothetical protein